MPELTYFEIRYWSAFSKLSNRRQSGFGPCPIAYGSINEWLDDNMILDMDSREDYRKFICFLDDEYLKRKAQEQKNKANQGAGGGQNRMQVMPPIKR